MRACPSLGHASDTHRDQTPHQFLPISIPSCTSPYRPPAPFAARNKPRGRLCSSFLYTTKGTRGRGIEMGTGDSDRPEKNVHMVSGLLMRRGGTAPSAASSPIPFPASPHPSPSSISPIPSASKKSPTCDQPTNTAGRTRQSHSLPAALGLTDPLTG